MSMTGACMVQVVSSHFVQCNASSPMRATGGAIESVGEGSQLLVHATAISSCAALSTTPRGFAGGGGIAIRQAYTSMDGCSMRGNSAREGGGMLVESGTVRMGE